MFGLTDRDIELIIQAIKNFDEIEDASIFGSRAMGNYKKGSDVDIAIMGKEVTRETEAGLSDLLNDIYPFPYFFDVLHFEHIKNEKLVEHINNVGIKIFDKTLKEKQ